MSDRTIVIDGPAASGKTSVARALSEHFKCSYISSGAWYRVVTAFLLYRGVNLEKATHPKNPDSSEIALATLFLESILVSIDLTRQQLLPELNYRNFEAELRTDVVNRLVAQVSQFQFVRDFLNGHFQRLATRQQLIVEGRDLGSVVFPQTPFKFYLDALPSIRQQRRQAEGECDEVYVRDDRDTRREIAPLKVAEGAMVIDTSILSLEEVIAKVIEQVERIEQKLEAQV